MRSLPAFALAFALSVPAPVQAQDQGGGSQIEEGLGLLEEGARRLLRGFGNEAAPMLRQLSEDVEPMLSELMGLIDDFSAYELPEKLPNGDIIIRRDTPRPDDAPAPEDGATESGSVEL